MPLASLVCSKKGWRLSQPGLSLLGLIDDHSLLSLPGFYKNIPSTKQSSRKIPHPRLNTTGKKQILQSSPTPAGCGDLKVEAIAAPQVLNAKISQLLYPSAV